ncbi:hypothetical protein EUGRSUZ_J02392 [Eucalyptus grandis]|uniref:Uncharacterized protein n=2 Tax=Eucalyptus grandis TaxID=71139 RepID=A0ACC3JA83_EUCGR|nr:hypothetical protein EUGRSUZ_J02392 [Eucalyptus grandis]
MVPGRPVSRRVVLELFVLDDGLVALARQPLVRARARLRGSSQLQAEPWEDKPPMKKQKSKPAAASETAGPARRCSHCGVQKTPQWRAGPNGAKTLCNACGVRFKSGRLYPEYRPACSPTFSSELHSNHHRKVLEMRRKKESMTTTALGQPEPGRAVPSF